MIYKPKFLKRVKFGLEHRWQKPKDILEEYTFKRKKEEYELGIFVKCYKVVGMPKRKSDGKVSVKNTFNDDNMVNSYYIRINLIVCSAWVSFTLKDYLGLKA
jgi:hypothetical protein